MKTTMETADCVWAQVMQLGSVGCYEQLQVNKLLQAAMPLND